MIADAWADKINELQAIDDDYQAGRIPQRQRERERRIVEDQYGARITELRNRLLQKEMF